MELPYCKGFSGFLPEGKLTHLGRVQRMDFLAHWQYTMIMTIDEVKVKVTPIFRKYGAEYAAVFGSVARGDDRPDSDVDFIVRLSRPVGFFKLSALADSLEQKLQRPVDVVEEEGLSRHMKPFIVKDLITVYEK